MSSNTGSRFALETKLKNEVQGFKKQEEKGILFKKGDHYVPTIFISTKKEGAKNGIVIWEYSEELGKYVTPIKELAKQGFSIEQLEGINHTLTILNHDKNVIVCLREEDAAMKSFKRMWKVGKVVKKKKNKKKDKSISKFSKLLQSKKEVVVESTFVDDKKEVVEGEIGVKPIQE